MSHKSLTELAIHKQQDAQRERRACERYGTVALNFRAERLESEAADILKLEHAPVVGIGGEVVAPQVAGLPHNQAVAVETLKEGATRIAEDASLRRTDLLLQPSFNAVALGVDAADSIQASNSMEKMLAHQMAVAHEASMRFMNRALSYEGGGRAMRDGDSVEACRIANTAARLMSVYQDGLLTLQRLRTGGNQTVTVQHVNVASGGQAVIGNVRTRGHKRRGASQKMGNAMHRALRCGAHARTTGRPCRSPAMKNGRCRMHGGKAGRKPTHGRYTKGAVEERRQLRDGLRLLRELIDVS
jgi:hypothetical protein